MTRIDLHEVSILLGMFGDSLLETFNLNEINWEYFLLIFNVDYPGPDSATSHTGLELMKNHGDLLQLRKENSKKCSTFGQI